MFSRISCVWGFFDAHCRDFWKLFLATLVEGIAETEKMAASVKFVERGQADPKEIDSTVRNKWNWGWCDKIFLKDTPDEHLVGDCFRKLHNPGEAWCLWCNDMVRYGGGGLNALRQHAKFEKHKKRYRERRTNYCLNFGNLNTSC